MRKLLRRKTHAAAGRNGGLWARRALRWELADCESVIGGVYGLHGTVAAQASAAAIETPRRKATTY